MNMMKTTMMTAHTQGDNTMGNIKPASGVVAATGVLSLLPVAEVEEVGAGDWLTATSALKFGKAALSYTTPTGYLSVGSRTASQVARVSVCDLGVGSKDFTWVGSVGSCQVINR